MNYNNTKKLDSLECAQFSLTKAALATGIFRVVFKELEQTLFCPEFVHRNLLGLYLLIRQVMTQLEEFLGSGVL